MGISERKEREKEQRKEEIVRSAEKVFFQKGLQQATMDEIAEVAELSKGTLYLYYKSKEDLYLGIHLKGEEILFNMFTETLATEDLTVRTLWNLSESYLRFYKQFPDHFRTQEFFENPHVHKQVSPEMMQECSRSNARLWELLLGVIRRAVDEGYVLPELRPNEVATILASNMNGLLRQIDRQNAYWHEVMGINLEHTLRLSNALLMRAMLTEKGKKEFDTLNLSF